MIHHGDCLEVMASMEAGTFDAIVTDPPYCSGGVTENGRGSAQYQGLRSETMKAERFSWFPSDNTTTAGLCWLLRAVAVEGSRLIKPSGHILFFCDWRMVPMIAPAVESAGWRYRSMIVWDKGGMGCGTGFRPGHECILHFTKPKPAFHSMSVSNLIRVSRVHSTKRGHPTEKPVELMEKLLSVVTPPGGVVLDPFAGSGTTALAARNTGRRAVLIEREAAYVEMIRKRLDGAALPLLDELAGERLDRTIAVATEMPESERARISEDIPETYQARKYNGEVCYLTADQVDEYRAAGWTVEPVIGHHGKAGYWAATREV